jgi:phospholipid/cholesterol/gamma-HCH transport system substrate-binding protein
LEIRVGITVVIASTILIIGIMWFQKFKLVEKRYRFFVRFPEVGGLNTDDPININGVEKGRVERIYLQSHDVVVEMGIVVGTEIPADSRITLQSLGIMGERFVEIRSGWSERMIRPGDTLTGQFDTGMSEVMGEAGSVLGELSGAIREFQEVLSAIGADDRLRSSMDDLALFSGNLRRLTADDQPLAKSIVKFDQITSRLDSLFLKRYAGLDSTLETMGRAGRRFEEAIADLAEASEALKDIAARLRAGEGTVGKLINDEEFLDKLDKTVTDLDDLIFDIKKHPGRYLSINLF